MIDPREVDKVPDEEWEEFKQRALKDELFYNGPGDLLDTGKEELLGGIRYVYQKDHILLPDGSREPVSYEYRMNYGADDAVWALTARSGWEWFNSVRNEDRFKDMIERAKKMK